MLTQAQGGGLTLAFSTRTQPPPSPATVAQLSGVIANAPLVHLTYPAGQFTRLLATYLGKLMPDKALPAPMPEEVRRPRLRPRAV